MASRMLGIMAVSLAGLAAAAAMAMDPSAVDVAGVRLGDDASRARAALARAGYRPRPSLRTDGLTYGESFAARVRREAAARRGAANRSPREEVITAIDATGPNQEWVRVELLPKPTGSAVTKVQLVLSADRMRPDEFLRQVEAKYGAPDRRASGRELTWCAAEARDVCDRPSPQRRWSNHPHLRATVLGGNVLRLSAGDEVHERHRREIAAAVDAVAPKANGAAF